jgi:microcystin-dependent protein
VLAISQNEALFSLYGTIYGGDGRTTFGLPDLRGRVPIHMGSGSGLTPRPIGGQGGSELVTLTAAQLPQHTHQAIASVNGGVATSDPANNFWSRDPGGQVWPYRSATNGTMNAGALPSVGGSQPHENMMPFLAITFIVALFGIYPPRS